MEHQSINIGIEKSDRHEIAEGLSRLLADTYTLYLKTHNFHWNVTGPMFQELHKMFETQYQDLADAVDTIAERIRALGVLAPASYSEFVRLSTIRESNGNLSASEMVRHLTEGHETIVRAVRSLVPLVSRVDDEASLDLLTERTRYHEKTAWMLRSLLESQTSARV